MIRCFKTYLSVILILVLTEKAQAQAQSNVSDFRKIAWLEGTWNRTQTKPGRGGNERWTKVSDTEWKGVGIYTKAADTTFMEKLQLVSKDGALYYVADVAENKSLVYFKFTELSENGFICENPQHDFPKKIRYERTGDKIKATVSDAAKSIEYFFERKK